MTKYLVLMSLVLLLTGAGCSLGEYSQGTNQDAVQNEVRSESESGGEKIPDQKTAEDLPIEGELIYKGFGEYFEDRFSGYHTGIDLEAPADTPVYAIVDGEVIYSGRVSGYGGVVVVAHELEGRTVSAIYGHLDPASIPAVGVVLESGEQIGVLGEEGSETDGEREHLHFAMYEGSAVRLNGYETDPDAMNNWLNPIDELGNKTWRTSRRASELQYGQGEEIFPWEFTLPEGWDIEYIPSIKSLNIYTVYGPGAARQRSQVLIRYFDASEFLTLSTVKLYSTEELLVTEASLEARRYDIEKNTGVSDFVDQPQWRNERHVVIDFRFEEGYTRYYVIAVNPEVDRQVYDALLDSIEE
ncbi:M23 family metallopeptidase [Candidatus Uhrbacteria bacterium]|nr:M23 family metallopeptidase [Candidatus Uhrbacteria bacterium]